MPNPFEISVSPDGRKIAFVAAPSPGRPVALFVRQKGSVTTQQIAGTEGATAPFWSPDSRYIGFAAGGILKKVDVLGGAPQNLCPAPTFTGGTWNKGGVIVFGSANPFVLRRVSEVGGEPVAITALDQSQQELSHGQPYCLPDGQRYLYSALSGTLSNNAIYVGRLDLKEKMRLYPQGPSRPMLSRVTSYSTAKARCSRSRSTQKTRIERGTGSHCRWRGIQQHYPARRFRSIARRRTCIPDRGGWELQFKPPELAARLVRSNGQAARTRRPKRGLLHDRPFAGSKVCRLSTGTPDDIWVTDIQRGVPSRFTSNPAVDNFPVWSPDGRTIAFRSNRDGGANLYQRAFGVVAEENLVTKDAGNLNDWARDGRYLVYDKEGDLWAVPLTGDRKPFHVTETPFSELGGRVSPDGHWIAYYSTESSPDNQPNQVYIQSFPERGLKQLVSTNGGWQLRWSRDGKEFFYIATDLTLMAVSIKPNGPSLEVGVPSPLFKMPIAANPFGRRDYDVSADGRFLINVANNTSSAASTAPINVTINWQTRLKK